MIEEWAPVVGFETYYDISNLGRLKSLARYCHAGRRGVQIKPERIIAGSTDRYLFTYLRGPDGLSHAYLHRLVAEAFLPNPDAKPCVNHLDGDKANNHVSNLEWVTYAENNRHAIETGLVTHPTGEDWHSTKLTADQVRQIRSTYQPGKNGIVSGNSAQLAAQYGVVRETINGIGNLRKWTEVDCALDCRCKVCAA